MNASDHKPEAPPTPSDHYQRAVASMVERSPIVTLEAVYNDKGMKLVDKGLRVDRTTYDRLARHALRHSLDNYLTAEDAVTVESLVELAGQLCQQDALSGLLAYSLGDQGEARLLSPLRALLLPQPLAFKLTVMREQHPQLFTHSVRMVLVAVFLGLKSNVPERDAVHLAAAALFHDLGVLYMDPVWRDPAHKITGAGRQQLLAHPGKAMELVQEPNVYPRSVGQAIREHHECMDGSGYPQGLQGAQISPMGKILLMAEVVSAFFEKYADEAPAQHLSLTLRLNHRKYPAHLVACLLPMLNLGVLQTEIHASQSGVERTIAVLSGAFDGWDARSKALPAASLLPPSEQACAFVAERLAALQKTLLEAGSHPQQQAEALPHLVGDAQSLAELALLGREALWQLQNLLNATHIRWPQLAQSSDAGDTAVSQWCNACAVQLQTIPAAQP